MVELRKRKAPASTPAAPPVKKTKAPARKPKPAAKDKPVTKDQPAPKDAPAAKDAPAEPTPKAEPEASTKDTSAPTVGATVPLIDGAFTTPIHTHDGKEVTIAQLLADSAAGIVLFTYPKASTPGCTTQACLFRDSHAPLTATGLALYGLSADGPKANATFAAKQGLPYALLCDPSAAVIGALGFKKAPRGTQRGVAVLSKEGKVLAREAGGPAATVEVVKRVVADMA